MNNDDQYPGTPQHQALLRQIVEHYRDDPRLLALCLFGSLGRGNWDEHSDLDLDLILADGASFDVLREVQAMCNTFPALGEHALIIAPDEADAADIILDSLLEISIRCHTLSTTKPAILDTLLVLCGHLSAEQIHAAGRANTGLETEVEAHPADTFLRIALAVDREIHRHRFWLALSYLDRLRSIFVEMVAEAHGGGRLYHVFEASAPQVLKDNLAATLPQPDLTSLQASFLHLLDLFEQSQPDLGNPPGLSPTHRLILDRIRLRQERVLFDQTPSQP